MARRLGGRRRRRVPDASGQRLSLHRQGDAWSIPLAGNVSRPRRLALRLPRLTRQKLFRGGEAAAELQRDAELLQHHLAAREPAQQIHLVEAAEMADAEDAALHVAESDPERQLDAPVRMLNE